MNYFVHVKSEDSPYVCLKCTHVRSETLRTMRGLCRPSSETMTVRLRARCALTSEWKRASARAGSFGCLGTERVNGEVDVNRV